MSKNWSPRNQSPKTYESPRIISFDADTFVPPKLVQLDSTGAEKCVVRVETGTDTGTARIGIRYHLNEEIFWLDKGTVMTFDGPRHPFWRPFYIVGEGSSDTKKLVFWLSGTQDGPVL
jgi:hypothetical protein